MQQTSLTADADSTGLPASQAISDRDTAIERVISSIDARVRRQHRMTMRPGEVIAIPKNGVTLVYVIKGALGIDAPPAGSPGTPEQVTAGDALMFTGQTRRSLRVTDHAFVLVSSLDFTETSTHILNLLPASIFVHDLPGSDPAVAALASWLGPELRSAELDEADGRPSQKSGSAVVCRMMANTVIVSIIRAWVVRGCAPDGWPSLTNDPYLDRVVDAIQADPSREWTLDSLARAGAMSRSVFAERFRSATGSSPANYVAEVRIRAAQGLLARGGGVSEVSRAIGYASDDGFSRAFRRRVGQTPSAWRTNAMRTDV